MHDSVHAGVQQETQQLIYVDSAARLGAFSDMNPS